MQANQQHTPRYEIGDPGTLFLAQIRHPYVQRHPEEDLKTWVRIEALENWAQCKDQEVSRLAQDSAQLFADTAPIGAMMDMMARMIEEIEWLKAQVRLLATP
jgi:hypothetical protein